MSNDIPTEEELSNPLSQERIANLKAWQKLVPIIEQNIKNGKLAGIDLSSQEEEFRKTKQQMEALLAVYG